MKEKLKALRVKIKAILLSRTVERIARTAGAVALRPNPEIGGKLLWEVV